jgi:hypothetical protein
MTELQMGLIGLGAAAVVAVLGYNKWQEFRQRKLAQQMLKASHADVLLDDGLPEAADPSPAADAPAEAGLALPPQMAPARGAAAFTNERIEPVFGVDPPPDEALPQPPVAPAEAPAARRAAAPEAQPQPASMPRASDDARDIAEPLHLLSPLVDYVAAFEAVDPAPAAQILEAQRAALARVRKPVHWIGYNALAREWEPVIDDGESEFRHFRAGLQLVDRRGPLSDNDLSVFHVAMQDLADQLMAIADLPARRSVLDSAAKLDGFCASVDIQIGINVISQGQAFPGTKLRALAEAAGMVIDGDGRFVRCDDDGNVLYVLLNQDASGFSVESMKTLATHGITFLLDVPRVAHGERVFNQMVDLARRFADVLRGSLVDDNRRPLSEGALEPIRRQVGEYQAMMAAQGLPAGGPLTRRLFS